MKEIWDDEVDIKRIMEEFKERTTKEEKQLSTTDKRISNDIASFSNTFRRDLEIVNNNWNIENEGYAIFSHRKVLGPILIKGRELVHGEVRRYVDPIFHKQREFNAATFRILKRTTRSLEVLLKKLNNLDSRVNEIEQKLKKFNEVQNDTPNSDYYYLFEDKFRGSREFIMERFKKYLKYFKGCKNVLDIGCGRGEFLELCKEHGTIARGVDIDENMVKYCQSRGLDVVRADALEYLKNLEDKSLDGILIAQVIEHLEPDYLVELLELCYRKLKSGYYIVIETVNPLSLTSLMNFYLDLTHKKPVHPETIKFLLEYVGFRDIKLEFHAKIPSEAKLMKINLKDFNEELRGLLDIYNKNIDMLNNLLFGAQDYVVVGRK